MKSLHIALTALLGLALTAFAQTEPVARKSAVSNQRYKIAVCDWMILKRQKLGAFQLTKDIGADGVEVDMGSLPPEAPPVEVIIAIEPFLSHSMLPGSYFHAPSTSCGFPPLASTR